MSRIEPDKVDGVINVEESQIVLENVFSPEMLDENMMSKMENMTLELSRAYQIEENNGIIIPKREKNNMIFLKTERLYCPK